MPRLYKAIPAFVVVIAFLSTFGLVLPQANAQVIFPSPPTITVQAPQPGDSLSTRRVLIAESAGDVQYFPNAIFNYWVTTDPSAGGPDDTSGQSSDGNVTLDLSVYPGAADVYILGQTYDKDYSNFTSGWSEPLLVSGPDYTGPVPTSPPSPMPTPTPTPTPKPTPTATCPALQIFGVRGSRGSASDTSNTDGVLDAVEAKIASGVSGVATTATDYPAIPVNPLDPRYGPNYLGSVDAGRVELSKLLLRFFAACARTYVVIVGYSQGAQVAGDVAITELMPQQQRHIAGLILLGDPRFSPKQTTIDNGDYSPKLAGSYLLFDPQLRAIPGALAPQVRSYCTAGDPVCNFSLANFAICEARLASGNCAHQPYIARGWADLAASQAIKRWHQLSGL